MTFDQARSLEAMVRDSGLDLGGEIVAQRQLLVEMLTAIPLSDDVRVGSGHLADIPIVSVDVDVDVDGVESDNVVFYLHGGAFALGTAASSAGLVSEVVRRAQARGVSVDYRLAPENPYPAALSDAVAAYEALLLTTDPGRIAMVGESAGGGLVLATLVALRERGIPLPSAAAVFSPWADLTLTGDSIVTKAEVDPALTGDGLRIRAGDYVGELDPSDPAISPVFADLTGLPPLLIQAGSHEILLDDAVRVAARAAAADVAVTLQITPGVPHVFQGFAAILSEGADALDAAGDFLRSHFTTRTAPPEA